jgi:hypothetical protein
MIVFVRCAGETLGVSIDADDSLQTLMERVRAMVPLDRFGNQASHFYLGTMQFLLAPNRPIKLSAFDIGHESVLEWR